MVADEMNSADFAEFVILRFTVVAPSIGRSMRHGPRHTPRAAR
jgi:hypothetical protein